MPKKISLVLLAVFVIVSIPTARATVSKHVFVVTCGERTFNVVIETTSTIGNFYFSLPLKQVGFQVSGTRGSFGFSNVTIPKLLLWAEDPMHWKVLIDGTKPSAHPLHFNGTHTMFYLGYVHSTHNITISGTHTVGTEPIRKVGVEPGFWIEYDMVYNFTTNDPRPPGQPPLQEAAETDYFSVEVLSTSGTQIAFLTNVHLYNGTEVIHNLTIDVDTGEGNDLLFIGANLSAGEPLYATRDYPRINSTLVLSYVGVEREVNLMEGRYNGTVFPNYRAEAEMMICWDRATGINLEYMFKVKYVELTEGYVTETSRHTIITSTNVWVEERNLLGQGVGFMKEGPKQLRFGRAELYKVGDEQIELVITCQGETYSTIWTIIRQRESRNHEWYFCRSPENGVLIVKLQHANRAFWLAVGRRAIAYGPLKQIRRTNFYISFKI